MSADALFTQLRQLLEGPAGELVRRQLESVLAVTNPTLGKSTAPEEASPSRTSQVTGTESSDERLPRFEPQSSEGTDCDKPNVLSSQRVECDSAASLPFEARSTIGEGKHASLGHFEMSDQPCSSFNFGPAQVDQYLACESRAGPANGMRESDAGTSKEHSSENAQRRQVAESLSSDCESSLTRDCAGFSPIFSGNCENQTSGPTQIPNSVNTIKPTEAPLTRDASYVHATRQKPHTDAAMLIGEPYAPDAILSSSSDSSSDDDTECAGVVRGHNLQQLGEPAEQCFDLTAEEEVSEAAHEKLSDIRGECCVGGDNVILVEPVHTSDEKMSLNVANSKFMVEQIDDFARTRPVLMPQSDQKISKAVQKRKRTQALEPCATQPPVKFQGAVTSERSRLAVSAPVVPQDYDNQPYEPNLDELSSGSDSEGPSDNNTDDNATETHSHLERIEKGKPQRSFVTGANLDEIAASDASVFTGHSEGKSIIAHRETDPNSFVSMTTEHVSMETAEGSLTERDFQKRGTQIESSDTAIDDNLVLQSNNTGGFNFTVAPTQLTGCWVDFEGKRENFLKGCKWSQDGGQLLTSSDDRFFRVFDLPPCVAAGGTPQAMSSEITARLSISDNELPYDFCWFPGGSSAQEGQNLFATSNRDMPVHLWDANTGGFRASYVLYNHVDEMITARSLAFTPDGEFLYCGVKKCIQVFRTSRPGRESDKRFTHTKQSPGQSGLISCIDFCAERGMYACGSYDDKAVATYTMKGGMRLSATCSHEGGVTSVKFSADGLRLYSGARKDPNILCVDVRCPERVLFRLQRPVPTNQRYYFDMDTTSRFLFSGQSNGTVYVWDTSNPPLDDLSLPAIACWVAHDDAVPCCSLHPTLPLLATGSGQRRFPVKIMQEEEGGNGSDDDEDTDHGDNSLRLWWLGQGASHDLSETVFNLVINSKLLDAADYTFLQSFHDSHEAERRDLLQKEENRNGRPHTLPSSRYLIRQFSVLVLVLAYALYRCLTFRGFLPLDLAVLAAYLVTLVPNLWRTFLYFRAKRRTRTAGVTLQHFIEDCEDLFKQLKKCLRFIQEAEVISRGYALVSGNVPISRLELGKEITNPDEIPCHTEDSVSDECRHHTEENGGLLSSDKTRSSVQQPRQHPALRKAAFGVSREIVLLFREHTETLLQRSQTNDDNTSTAAPGASYLCRVPLDTYGPIMMLALNPASFSLADTSDEDFLLADSSDNVPSLAQETASLVEVTDGFSLSSIKAMSELALLHVSEYLRKLTLICHEDASGLLERLDFYPLLSPAIVSVQRLTPVLSTACAKCNPTNTTPEETGLSLDSRHRSRDSPSTNDAQVAVRSLVMHLRAALDQATVLEESLFCTDSEIELETKEETLGFLNHEITSCRTCLDVAIKVLRKTSRKDGELSDNPLAGNRENVPLDHSEPVSNDSRNVSDCDANAQDMQVFECYGSPLDVALSEAEEELLKQLDAEELERRKQEQRDSETVLAELRGVIAPRARQHRERERVARQRLGLGDDTPENYVDLRSDSVARTSNSDISCAENTSKTFDNRMSAENRPGLPQNTPENVDKIIHVKNFDNVEQQQEHNRQEVKMFSETTSDLHCSTVPRQEGARMGEKTRESNTEPLAYDSEIQSYPAFKLGGSRQVPMHQDVEDSSHEIEKSQAHLHRFSANDAFGCSKSLAKETAARCAMFVTGDSETFGDSDSDSDLDSE